LQDCCKETDENMRLEGSLYLLFNILPLLRHIQKEQRFELEVEANIRGTILIHSDNFNLACCWWLRMFSAVFGLFCFQVFSWQKKTSPYQSLMMMIECIGMIPKIMIFCCAIYAHTPCIMFYELLLIHRDIRCKLFLHGVKQWDWLFKYLSVKVNFVSNLFFNPAAFAYMICFLKLHCSFLLIIFPSTLIPKDFFDLLIYEH